MNAPRWHYLLPVAAMGLLMLLSGCTVRQRLHIATAADLVSTHEALQIRGAREANPLFSGMTVAQMAVTQLAVNEGVLWWERKACRVPESRSCRFASAIRLGMTAGHATGATLNTITAHKHRDD
jgi:uncharacterized membrane protein